VSDTNVTIVGNVATEPHFKIVGDGIPRCSFRLASSTRRRDGEDGSWVDGPTSWYTVTAWRALAENILISVFKGDPIVVTGRLQVREWTTEERAGTSVEIDAATLGHDLQRGRSRFTRVTRRPRVPAGEESGADAAADQAAESSAEPAGPASGGSLVGASENGRVTADVA
jgi:single-strand DNA-binding protein